MLQYLHGSRRFFLLLYPAVPLIGLAGYGPQLVTLLKTDRPPHSISLSTWFTWALTWFISFGYAAFYVQDILFALTSAMNLAGHICVIGLTLYKRNKYSERPLVSGQKRRTGYRRLSIQQGLTTGRTAYQGIFRFVPVRIVPDNGVKGPVRVRNR